VEAVAETNVFVMPVRAGAEYDVGCDVQCRTEGAHLSEKR
jgi:hypothetical protein